MSDGGERPEGHLAERDLPTMRIRALDWLLAGSTVGLGLAMVAAPFALTPRLSSLYALHGALEDASTLSRWMMSPWLPPLLAAVPMAVAIYSTVTHMRPRPRRVLLLLALLVVVASVAVFVRGLLSPILAVAGGGA